jgi:hypothetical protein
MSTVRNSLGLAIVIMLTVGMTVPVCAQEANAALDSTLFTTYTVNSPFQNVAFTVCGSLPQSSGCYGGGSLGPFNKVGALLEGIPSTKGNVVSRAIYVVDAGDATVQLYAYKKTDTITASFDTVNVTLAKMITLPLTGGSTALSFMAANNGFLFIGTDQTPQAVRVEKNNLSVTQLGGFSPPINVTAITADSYGYVTVTQGGINGGESGFSVYGPDGSGEEDGGGAPFMLNTRAAVLTSTLPQSDDAPAQRLEVRPKMAK